MIEFRDGVSVGIDNHEADGQECERQDDAQQRSERQPTSSDLFHQVDADESAEKVDGSDEGRQPNCLCRVVESGHLDDGGAVVHDRVDSGNLLKHLQQTAEEERPADGRTLQDLDDDVGRLSPLASVLLMHRRGAGNRITQPGR